MSASDLVERVVQESMDIPSEEYLSERASLARRFSTEI